MTVLAVDVGGTNLRAALVEQGTIHHRLRTVATPPDAHSAALDLVTRLVLAHPGSPPLAVGIGVPEYVRDGRVTSQEVVAWPSDGAELLARTVSELTGAAVPVVVEADVRCGAVAEHSRLDRPDRESLLYLSWGTGISSAFVLPGGVVWQGARGEALALGEWRDGEDRRLEDIASGRGIEQRYLELSGRQLDAIAVHARAIAGDLVASRLFERAGRALGRAILQLIDVLDPHHVALGGGLGTADQLGAVALAGEVTAGTRRPGRPPVGPARCGADAGLLGAAILAAGLVTP